MLGHGGWERTRILHGRKWAAWIVESLAIFCVLAATVLANDAARLLPERPSGRVADLNRNPALSSAQPIQITYGGDVIFRFPNYSFRILNHRENENILPGEAGSTLVFHNDAGMFWDGRALILTPSYSSWLLVKDRFARGIVGDPQLKWPWLEQLPEPTPPVPLAFPTQVGYRSMAERETEVGPQHGAAPAPLTRPKSFVTPLKPKLGMDGVVRYVPLNSDY
jgi:hypothetical protein